MAATEGQGITSVSFRPWGPGFKAQLQRLPSSQELLVWLQEQPRPVSYAVCVGWDKNQQAVEDFGVLIDLFVAE